MFTINQNLIDDFADKINEKEKKSNKVTSLSSSSTNVEYPSAKAVYDAIDDLDIEWNNIQNKPTLFSGSYADLTNKPSYTPTITSSTNGAYKIGSINISGSNVDIYGKDTDTHQDITGKEDKSNKVTSISSSSTDTEYPSAKCVYDGIREFINTIYPVGSIYMSANDINPSTLFGGTWERIQDRFLLAKGSTYTTLEGTGGSATVSLSASQMPRHNHSTNSHYHKASESNEYYITSTANGASNKRVSVPSSGSNYADVQSSGTFHHRTGTDSQAPSTKYSGGTDTSESASNGSAHENMPPYIVVNVWKRTA